MERLIVRSIVTPKNLYIMMAAVMVLLAMSFMTVYKWFTLHLYQPLEIMFEVGVLAGLIERMSAKYTYEMKHNALLIKKDNWFGIRRFEVFYRDILGIYRYQPKLIGIMHFRRTYRLHSALDGRNVLTIAYAVVTGSGKRENRRIYFKPSEELLAALQRKLPHKVLIAEEKVVLKNLKHASLKRR